MDGLDTLKEKYLSAIKAAETEDALETVRVEGLGKKGEISLKMRELGLTISPVKMHSPWSNAAQKTKKHNNK